MEIRLYSSRGGAETNLSMDLAAVKKREKRTETTDFDFHRSSQHSCGPSKSTPGAVLAPAGQEGSPQLEERSQISGEFDFNTSRFYA